MFSLRSSALYLCIGLLLVVSPRFAFAEVIHSFSSNIEIHEDSSFTVTERITYDFESTPRHGIFRYVLTKHPQGATKWYLSRYVDVSIRSVLRDGKPELYTESNERDQVFLKIGDPDHTITGTHTYEITYVVVGGLSFFGDKKAEIYWNVTGTDWPVPIEYATAVVQGPHGLLSDQHACYQGIEGSGVACGDVEREDDSISFTIQGSLLSGEGLTVAQALDASVLSDATVLERVPVFWPIIGGVVLWFSSLVFLVSRFKQKYKTRRTIIAQYEPYKNYKPMYTGLLFDGRLDPQDITAGIIYLAEQGYLKIAKTEQKVLFFFEVDDYQITLQKPAADLESAFLKKILELLFGGVQQSGESVTLFELKGNHRKQKENYELLVGLRKELSKDLISSGFYQSNLVLSLELFSAATAIGVGAFVGFGVFENLYFGILSALAAITAIVVPLFVYKRRTRKGYEALDHLKGFKLFLETTEKERYVFHNAPEKSPEQFMKFLPYAIAFGVEKKWADVFRDITIPNPSWYDAGTSGASFSAVGITESLGSFSNTFTASSGSSGSSGGGSVGGGGGGGGGGSW